MSTLSKALILAAQQQGIDAKVLQKLFQEMPDHVAEAVGAGKPVFKRATLDAQGRDTTRVTVRFTGETATDGKNHRCLIPYTTSVVGATGGPANGHDLLVWEGVVLGRLS